MSLRITQNSMNRTQLMGLNSAQSRLQGSLEQATTQKRLNRPSDDPVGTVQALRFRGEQAQIAQHGLNITDGLSRLQASDDALSQANNMVQSVRTSVLQAANGTLGPNERKAIAEQVRGMREGLLQQANSQYAGQPLFGGTTPLDNAFGPDGTFQGNTLPVLRQVSDSPGDAGQMNVGVNGKDAFGNALVKGTGDLDKLAAAIENGDGAGMKAGLDALDTLRTNISNVQSSVGVRSARLASLEALNSKQEDAATIGLSKVEDTDFVKVAMDMAVQSQAYQAALSASAKIIQPSLMDFIR